MIEDHRLSNKDYHCFERTDYSIRKMQYAVKKAYTTPGIIPEQFSRIIKRKMFRDPSDGRK